MKFEDIRGLLRELRERWDIYLVGGVLRDWVLKDYKDFLAKDCDFVLIGGIRELKEVVDFLKDKGFVLKKFSQFGTAEMLFKGVNFDIAICRKEIYDYPGALPKVEFVKNLEVDVLRRDFTANALYFDGERIIDFVKGLDDIRERVLRPLASFSDDPTRILRGIRYKNLLGFDYADEFFKFLEDGRGYIKNVSYQRLLNELRITSKIPKKAFYKAFKEMVEFDVLFWIGETPRDIYKKWKGFYVGKPNKYRWVILLAPFVKGGLPLEGEEMSAIDVLKLPDVENNIERIHEAFSNRRDLDILTYANWKGKDKRIFRFY
ncbi:MAG: hypothetical protein ABIL42_01925, partial [candidate division WOR-3 bacterium]